MGEGDSPRCVSGKQAESVLSIKPLQLENWKIKVKMEYWDLLMNPPKGWQQLQHTRHI